MAQEAALETDALAATHDRRLDFLLKLASEGWHIGPVNRKDPGAYVGKGWEQKFTSDAATITAWRARYPDANWGVELKSSGLAVIDLDSDDPRWLSALGLQYGVDFDAGRVSISGGGPHRRHVFYLAGTQPIPAGKHPWGEVFDGSTSRMIVLPGSVHPDTQETYRRHVWGDVPDGGGAPKVNPSSADALGGPERKLSPVIKDKNYNNAFWSRICATWAQGDHDPDELFAMYHGLDQTHDDPMGEAVIRSMVDRCTAKYERGKPQRQPIQRSDAEPLRLLTTDDMRAMPPADYVLPPYIARGVNFLVGQPATWKTFLALAWSARADGPVIYVCREGVGSLAKRLDAYCDAHGLATADQVRWIVDDVQLPDDAGRIIEAIGDLAPAMIVVDTLTDTSAGLDENSSDMRRVYAAMRTLQLHYGCAVLTLVHAGWNGKRERGHSSIRGMADNTMLLERNGTDDEPGPVARLRCMKMRDDEAFAPEYLQLHTGDPGAPFTRAPAYLYAATADDWHDGEAKQLRADGLRARVYQFVADNPDCTGYAVRHGVRGGNDAIVAALDALVADDRIVVGVGGRRAVTYHVLTGGQS